MNKTRRGLATRGLALTVMAATLPFGTAQGGRQAAEPAAALAPAPTPVKGKCLFGDLEQLRAAQRGHNDQGLWDSARVAGEDGRVKIVYRIADLLHGPSQHGGQSLEFGVLNMSDTAVRVQFIVVVTSNIGRWFRYHLGLPRVAALGEISGGGELSKEPFPPGECIAEIDVSDIRSAPVMP
jgi:hypothetical protein